VSDQRYRYSRLPQGADRRRAPRHRPMRRRYENRLLYRQSVVSSESVESAGGVLSAQPEGYTGTGCKRSEPVDLAESTGSERRSREGGMAGNAREVGSSTGVLRVLGLRLRVHEFRPEYRDVRCFYAPKRRRSRRDRRALCTKAGKRENPILQAHRALRK